MPRTRQLGLALRQMLPFSERRKGFGKDPRYRLSTRRRRHSVPFQLRDRSRFRISRTLLSPGPQQAPAPQFRSTPCGAISSRSILPLAAARSKSLTDLQTILPTPLRLISRLPAKVPPRRDCRSIQSCDRWRSRVGRLKIAVHVARLEQSVARACCGVAKSGTSLRKRFCMDRLIPG